MATVTSSAVDLLPQVDTVIFDVDGVLLDVSRSIRAVNCLVVPTYLRTLPGWTAPGDVLASEEIERFKNAGGFNDDWDLSCAAVLLYLFKAARYGNRDAARLHPLSPTIEEFTDAVAARGGWLHNAEAFLFGQATPAEEKAIRSGYDPRLIHRLFQELWAGDNTLRLYGYAPQFFPGPGWVAQDRRLLDLSRLPHGKTMAILTGRTRSEAELALDIVGLTGRIPLPENGMTRDDGNAKPNPDGLRRLVQRIRTRVALYIGDALDDLRTVQNFRRLPEAAEIIVLSAQVLTGTVGPDAPRLFADADILAPDVNAVLDRLRG